MTLREWARLLARPLFTDELTELDSCRKEITDLQQTLSDAKSRPPETVEVVREVPVSPKEFLDEGQMRNWFRSCPVRLRQYQKTAYDCDDYARDTQRLALEDGYLVNFQVDTTGQYCDGHPHFLCNCVVGNWSIVMEPQTGQEVDRLRID